jgi:hypothetical protein
VSGTEVVSSYQQVVVVVSSIGMHKYYFFYLRLVVVQVHTSTVRTPLLRYVLLRNTGTRKKIFSSVFEYISLLYCTVLYCIS